MTSGADVVINTQEVATSTTQNNEHGDSYNYELHRSLNILPDSEQYDPKKLESSQVTSEAKKKFVDGQVSHNSDNSERRQAEERAAVM